jgi:hypothetical protein
MEQLRALVSAAAVRAPLEEEVYDARLGVEEALARTSTGAECWREEGCSMRKCIEERGKSFFHLLSPQ